MQPASRAVLPGIAASHAHVIGVAVSFAGHHHAGTAAPRVWFSKAPQPAVARRERRQARIQTAIPSDPSRFARLGGQRKTGPSIAPIANLARAQSCKKASVPRRRDLSAVMDKDQKERLLKSKGDHSPCDRMDWTSTRHNRCFSDARGIPLLFHLAPAKLWTRVGGAISEKKPCLHVFLLLRTFARVPAGVFFFNLL